MAKPSTDKAVKGVLHLSSSEQHYNLNRKPPSVTLIDIVEQYWLVTWDLRNQPPHIQQNLPDPCANLFFDRQGAKLLGPISKSYTYEMRGKGHVFGVKFKPAGFCSYTTESMSNLTEQSLDPKAYFRTLTDKAIAKLMSTSNLEDAIDTIEPLLLLNLQPTTEKQLLANTLVDTIKTSPHITTVNQLAEHFSIELRTLQRFFERYIGLSPKWIIRKYRLHEALNKIETKAPDWVTTSQELGYADQAHFIKDFKDMIGMTPAAYFKDKQG